MRKFTPTQLDEFLTRTVDTIIGESTLKKQLTEGKKLRIKYGVDVTAPFLHLGHAVNLWMMRELQDLGHTVIFLIGDSTTKIGDPTGKSQTRKTISEADIKKNSAEFIKQVGKILSTNKTVFEVRRNSEWWGKMNTEHFLVLTSMVTHAQLIERDMFQKRLKNHEEIHMHEMLYPILQGYDSFMLKSDLTIVGNDQLFNESMGRFYQEKFGQSPQTIITTKITPGLDGKEKQSKSLNNYIALTDSPSEMFGKVMSLPDELIISYFEVYTRVPLNEIKQLANKLKQSGTNPRDIKMKLAEEITAIYCGKVLAKKAATNFVSAFQKRTIPNQIPTMAFPAKTIPLIDLLVKAKLVTSNSEAKRMILQQAVKINQKLINDVQYKLTPLSGTVIQVGKRRFLKIK